MIQLDNIAITLRPRGNWQAMDLGLQMARRWCWPLSSLWLCTALPVFLILQSLPGINDWVGLLIWWWCKPLYEAPLHYWCSRALFGERVSHRQALRATLTSLPGLLMTYLGPRRTSLARSVHVNVLILENQRGAARSQRISTIARRGSRAAILTTIGLHAEVTLTYGCVLLAAALLPPELVDVDWWQLISAESGNWLTMAFNWMSLFAAAIVAPFFVCAGFSLYINRRTLLEAWDLQLDFHRAAQRHTAQRHPLLSALLLCLLTVGADPPAASASVNPAQLKSQINDILDDPAFGQTQRLRKLQFVEREAAADRHQPALLATLLNRLSGYTQALLWVVFVASMLALGWMVWRFSPASQAMTGRRPPIRRPAASHPRGPLPALLPLPDDPARRARQLIGRGQPREALSLLYRASLAHPLLADQPTLHSAATEAECLQLAQRVLPRPMAETFARLTRQWQRQAYAGRSQSSQQLLALCDHWQRQFGQS